jgi:hypothetical protein
MNDVITRRAAIARVAYLLGGAVSASTVAGVLAGCDRLGRESAGSALSADQKELVASLAEYILPETDTPGARSAGVHDFIDVMMTDYYPAEERDRFLAGLTRVDQRSERTFGVRFLEGDPAQQLDLVVALNRQAFQDAAAVAPDSDWDPEDVGRQSFFRTFKELVLVGYYTSEPGATLELRMNPLGSWTGDLPYADIGRAWA